MRPATYDTFCSDAPRQQVSSPRKMPATVVLAIHGVRSAKVVRHSSSMSSRMVTHCVVLPNRGMGLGQ